MAKKKYALTAVIYDKRGNTLSIGHNSYIKTHTMQARIAKQLGMEEKMFLHAEVASIIKCKNIDKAHKIAVFRFDAEGKPVNAKPCAICMEAIRQAGISVVSYTEREE